MRKLLFIFAFLLCLTPVFAQKLVYKDIAGTWDVIDTSQSTPPFSIKFIDGSTMVLMAMGIELGKQPFTYKIDTSGNTTTLLIKGTCFRQ